MNILLAENTVMIKKHLNQPFAGKEVKNYCQTVQKGSKVILVFLNFSIIMTRSTKC